MTESHGRFLKTWTFFKSEIVKVKEQAVPPSSLGVKLDGDKVKLTAWLNRELLQELRKKTRIYELWKKGQTTHKDCRAAMKLCSEKMREA